MKRAAELTSPLVQLQSLGACIGTKGGLVTICVAIKRSSIALSPFPCLTRGKNPRIPSRLIRSRFAPDAIACKASRYFEESTNSLCMSTPRKLVPHISSVSFNPSLTGSSLATARSKSPPPHAGSKITDCDEISPVHLSVNDPTSCDPVKKAPYSLRVPRSTRLRSIREGSPSSADEIDV